MTPEKHPLQKVLLALEIAAGYPALVASGISPIPITRNRALSDCAIISDEITTLTTYMGQTQSCAECERLGRENALLREVVRDFAGGIAESDCFNLDKLLQKHADTIAAAGGES